jgi:sulfur carrier protein ThiS
LKKPQTIPDKKTQPHVAVHVKLSDFLAKLVPEAEFEVKIVTGSTVDEFISVLTERYGDEFRRAVVDRNGKLHGDIAVVLDKQLIPPQKFTQHTIHQNSTLSIIPIVGGG